MRIIFSIVPLVLVVLVAFSEASFHGEVEGVSGIGGGVAVGVNHILQGIKGSVDVVTKDVGNVGGIVGVTLGNVVHTVVQIVKAIPPNLLKGLSFLPFVGGYFNTLKDKTVSCNLQTDEAALTNALTALGHCIKEPAVEIDDDVGEIFNSVQKVLTGVNSGLNEALKAKGLKETLTKLGQSVGSLIQNLIGIFRAKIHTLVTIISSLPSFLKCLGNDVVWNYLTTLLTQIRDYFACYVHAFISKN